MNQTEIDAIANIVTEWGNERAENARGILTAKNATASRILLQSIRTSNTKVTAESVSIGIIAEDYYMFVDQGVKGLQNKKQNTGKFAFKNMGVGKRFKAAIADWITNKGIQVRQDKKESVKTVIERRDSMAFAIAKGIKKHGLRRTDFWSDTFNQEAYQDLADRIGKALGKTFTITIK